MKKSSLLLAKLGKVPPYVYKIIDNKIWLYKTGGKESLNELANFTAAITEDIQLIDGAAQPKREFGIDGSLGPIKVMADEFDSLQWITRLYGSRAWVAPEHQLQVHLKAAIKKLSANTIHRQVYKHTGWRQISGRWVYLHAGGGINAKDGDKITTALDGRLGGFDLPEVPHGDELNAAVHASLSLLNIGVAEVCYPLFSACWRAPLAEFAMIRCSLLLVGPTGVLKTAVARLAQAHWGTVWLTQDPASWGSTANYLEIQSFLVKDALLLIDDFVSGPGNEVPKLLAKAEQVLRGAANRSGRGRMTSDIRMRPEYFPRGLIIVTGEDIPRGHSLNARIEVVHVQPDDVDTTRLSKAQAQGADGLFASAMAGFIQWIAEHQDKAQFQSQLDELRGKARGEITGHRRTPDNAADLMLGCQTFLAFALDKGAIDQAKHDRLHAEAWAALLEGTKEQAEGLKEQDPAASFMELLTGAIRSGRAHLDDPHLTKPNGRQYYGFSESMGGWRCTHSYNSQGDQEVRWAPAPGSKRVGWLAMDQLFLDPHPAYAAAQQMALDSGRVIGVSPATLWRRLKEAKLLTEYEWGHTTKRRTIDNQRVHVLCLHARVLGWHEKIGGED